MFIITNNDAYLLAPSRVRAPRVAHAPRPKLVRSGRTCWRQVALGDRPASTWTCTRTTSRNDVTDAPPPHVDRWCCTSEPCARPPAPPSPSSPPCVWSGSKPARSMASPGPGDPTSVPRSSTVPFGAAVPPPTRPDTYLSMKPLVTRVERSGQSTHVRGRGRMRALTGCASSSSAPGRTRACLARRARTSGTR